MGKFDRSQNSIEMKGVYLEIEGKKALKSPC